MRSIIPLALALLAGCAGPSQSAGGDPPPAQDNPPAAQPAPQPPAAQPGGQEVTVDLVAGEGSSSAGDQSATAEGAAGIVTVRGRATTPNPCHRLAGSVARSGSTVTLRVSATVDPEVMCVASIGEIPYTATIRGLPAGAYDLRVEHVYPNTGWDTASVLQTRVTVR